MSRILRRPLFRGGPASSEGVGITSGLNEGYATGGRVGYQKAGSVGDSTFAERFKNAIEQTNANEQARYDLLKSNKSYDLANLFKSNSDQTDSSTEKNIDRSNITTEDVFKPYTLAGDTMRLFTNANELGYNFGVRPILNAPKLASNYIFGTDFKETPSIDYTKELIKNLSNKQIEKIIKEKEKNNKIDNSKPSIEPNYETEKPTINKIDNSQALKQDIDTYTKLLMENAGSDKDEYTRQKYLTLAKFGLNLLKPTPVGIKPSLATSLASAAEKPLEEYGNISMQQSKEDRALRQAAVQLGIQKHMPGTIAKGIQDLMAMNPSMTAQEATSIATTGKNAAAIAKEKFNEVIQRQKDIEDLATKDPALKKLSKIDPTFSNTYAQIATEQGLYGHELKGLASDYSVYQPGSIYYAPDKQTGQLLPHKFIKGKFYSIREPEFKQKGI